MKIRHRLVTVFSLLIVAAIGITSVLTVHFVRSRTITHELEQMHSRLAEIENNIQVLHSKASEDIVFALKNPIFAEYFNLPETRAGNEYKNGILQLTPRQHQLKSRLEEWIFHFQNKFNVDETCLIDKYGQEHVRIFRDNIEADENLSPHEQHEPFFESSFEKNRGEVHLEYPYLSSDTHRWVFAYTSPVVLEDGEKPGFFHFEMPIAIFHDLLRTVVGRMYVVDPKGYLIGDTATHYPTTNVPTVFADYFPPVSSISKSESFRKLLNTMVVAKRGDGVYVNDDVHHVAYKRLGTFDWILVYEVPERAMMQTGEFSVIDLERAVGIVAGIIIVVTVVIVLFVANRISHPIVKLRDATQEIASGSLSTNIDVSGKDEIRDLAESFAAMTKSLRRTIELEKRLAISEQKLKQTKLTTMGSISARLAHDIRNLLSTIKTTAELIKSNVSPVDERMAEQYKRLDRAVERMVFQVDSVMNFVRTKPLDLSEHEVADLVDRALSDVRVPEGIILKRPEPGVRAYCDGKQLEILFANLITNSMEAVGGRGEIDITAEIRGDRCIIEVQDSGPGIPEEILPRIFEPLYTTKQEGTGLGLVSCRSIVEQHKGTLTVRNNPTRFIIELPREPSPTE